jgi:hypothetical protein
MISLPLKSYVSRVEKGVWLLVAVYILSVAFGLTPWIYSDGVGDYSWVRTAIMDGDLDCSNEFVYFVEQFKQKYGWPEASADLYPVKTSTGYQANKYPIGTAILWSPFFILGHLITIGSNLILSSDLPTDGYSKWYIFFVTLGSTFYAFMGLLLSYKLARSLFSEFISLIATFAVWFASSIPVYMYLYPSMPHNTAFFTVAIFVFYFYKTGINRTTFQWILLGIFGGLMMATRLESVVILCLPFIELLFKIKKSRSFDSNSIVKIGIYGLFIYIAFLPQMFVWKVVFGKYFLNSYTAMHRMVELEKINLYGILPSGKELEVARSAIGAYLHFLSQPKIHVTLFGSSYGLFTWTPILLLAVVGIFFLIRKNMNIGVICLAGFFLLVYITSCSHKGGMSFGDRYLIKASPFLIVGLAAFFDILRDKLKTTGLVIITTLFVVWNGLFIVQYSTGLINRQGSISWQKMIKNQFTEAPVYFVKMAKPFITGRSSVYKGNNQE